METAADRLASKLMETRAGLPEALTEDQIQSASAEVAGWILGDESAFVMVAALARSAFVRVRRSDTRTSEEAARKSRDQAFQDEENSRPTWTGGDPGRSGRWNPRPATARDDAARDRRTSFLDKPIARLDEEGGEILWGDATAAILRARRDWYTKKILGWTESRNFIDEQIDVITSADDTETITLREAYARLAELSPAAL